MKNIFYIIFFYFLFIFSIIAAEIQQIKIVHLNRIIEREPTIYSINPEIINNGILGSRMGIKDNNTTGKFTNQNFELIEQNIMPNESAKEIFEKFRKDKYKFFILNVSKDDFNKILSSDLLEDALLINTSLKDNDLRNEKCNKQILHTAPSYRMLSDALTQFLKKKNWVKLLLISGVNERDKQFADSIKVSSKRFGLKIINEKIWDFNHDFRRSADLEVVKFTQGEKYEVLVLADEGNTFGDSGNSFGDYIPYRTWKPTIVVGGEVLKPTSWHFAHEQWGGNQMQSRFLKDSKRLMTNIDFNSWVGVRAIGEAITRTKSLDSKIVLDKIMDEKFNLAAYKGKPVSFRKWNGQLRQPILLVTPRALVSVSPQIGFVHPRTELDTLGVDQPDTKCRFN
ncbi:MAG: branched-chain amino acid ABC transporter substrate-binding protein [Alphaproteobacteria bacterium]|nr:branched-chain amino acid ABC transporter substrate-binding protein [Alphaproteobacteria bacterium]|tara:strand:- start:2312 stop:3499 length:1188 start_codon:yes stop_codon:yes gene_type:complete